MKCNIARDLLPLYFDGLCSEETGKQLEEHMEHCENCRQLKRELESERNCPDEDQEWDQTIAPLKKVRKKMQRKNVLIAVCVCLLLLLIGFVSLLTYGQIARKGISFELLYDAVRFRRIGQEFAAGNIEPLYKTLSTGYTLQDAESGVVRMVYADRETYDQEMQETILTKYHQYFDGRSLTYRGIEEIGYMESAQMGGISTLYIALKFEGQEHMEYYLSLYKTSDGQYLVDDFLGDPYLTYTDEEAGEESGSGYTESYHTDDTLFSCLPNRLKDIDLYVMRQIVARSGQRALEGDTVLAEHGQMRLNIKSEQDLADDTNLLQEELNDKLGNLAAQGSYVTDITWSVKDYDQARHLYRYEITLELTDQASHDKIRMVMACYRVSDAFVYIPGTDKLYGEDLSPETVLALAQLFQ